MEEKLDDLVSLIRSQTAVKGPNESPPVPTPASLGQSTSDGTALPSSDSSPNTVGTSAATCRAWGGKTNPSSSSADSELDYYVPENEAQERLDLFRRDYPQFGPIVYIPPKMTAKELQQTRPLLWISIMACTTRSTKESHLIGDKVRHIVSDRVVRQYDRSLDLLQGLLVFLCWSVTLHFLFNYIEKSLLACGHPSNVFPCHLTSFDITFEHHITTLNPVTTL